MSIWFSIQEHNCYKLREKLTAWNLECIVGTTRETEAACFTFYGAELLFSHALVSCSAAPWTAACQVSWTFTTSRSLLKLMFIEPVIPSNHLLLCHPLLLLPSIYPPSGSFPRSQFFTSCGQSIGASALALVLPMNIQDWFPWGLTNWISLQSKGLWRVFSKTTVRKHNSLVLSFLYSPISHSYMNTGKP